jgi:hypothetical protein
MTSVLQSEMPWYESAEDATSSALAKGRALILSRVNNKKLNHIKVAAVALWPGLNNEDSAYARLKDALNPDRPAKLTADEHIFLANFCQEYDFLRYTEAQCHHAGSELLKPEDEQAHLQQIIIQGQRELTQALNRYNALRPSVA